MIWILLVAATAALVAVWFDTRKSGQSFATGFQQPFPPLTFCPAFVPPNVGHATDQQTDGGFPVSTAGYHSSASATDSSKEVVIIPQFHQESGLIKFSHAGGPSSPSPSSSTAQSGSGRFAGQPIEPYMMNWLPTEFIKAIILDPPVIYVGDRKKREEAGVASSERTDLFPIYNTVRDLQLLLKTPRDLQLDSQAAANDKEDNDSHDNDDDFNHGMHEESPIRGFTRVKRVRCTQTQVDIVNGTAVPIRRILVPTSMRAVSRTQYLSSMGVSVTWAGACREVVPSLDMRARVFTGMDHLTCDVEMGGDLDGVYLVSGGDNSGSLQQWTWLQAAAWNEVDMSRGGMLSKVMYHVFEWTVSRLVAFVPGEYRSHFEWLKFPFTSRVVRSSHVEAGGSNFNRLTVNIRLI